MKEQDVEAPDRATPPRPCLPIVTEGAFCRICHMTDTDLASPTLRPCYAPAPLSGAECVRLVLAWPRGRDQGACTEAGVPKQKVEGSRPFSRSTSAPM